MWPTSSSGTGSPADPSSMDTSSPPTGMVCPSVAAIWATTPAKGLGSSTIDFAVSTSHSTSLTSTASPAATRQDTTSASVSPSPGSGMQ